MPLIFEKVKKSVQVCTGATCDKCDVSIPPSMLLGKKECSGFTGALYVEISGGSYGEYLDGMPKLTSVLCTTCASNLIKENRFLLGQYAHEDLL